MRQPRRRWCLGAVAGLAAAALAQTPAVDRPQLDGAAAARHQIADYLAQGPAPWQPAEVEAAAWVADFVVATDGSGTHRTVQEAVEAVPGRADGGAASRAWVIRIRPGTYRGPLCVKDKAPLRLVGEPGQAGAVVLVDGRYNGLRKAPGAAPHPCLPPSPAERHGTSGSATAVIASPDVVLAHLTVANDALEARPAEHASGAATGRAPIVDGAQAVALLTLADRIQLESVHLRSHQDTFYVRRPAAQVPARVFVRRSVIAGDVDFIFGNATLVIDDSTVISRSDRRGAAAGGIVLAPSTPAAAPLGFLIQRTRFVADAELPAGKVSLGRAWDEGVAPGTWQPGLSPNGQALVRDSVLGPHIGGWTSSTSGRPFTPAADAAPASANRLSEYRNTVPAQPAPR